MELAMEMENFENRSAELCVGVYFGIRITTEGAEKVKRRYFTSCSVVKTFNSQILKKT